MSIFPILEKEGQGRSQVQDQSRSYDKIKTNRKFPETTAKTIIKKPKDLHT